MGNYEFNWSGFLKIMVNLDPHKSIGHDEVSAMLLKQCASYLYKPITFLFNLCLNSGIFLPEWKVQKICPAVPKKGTVKIIDRSHISLLCVIAKVFEKAVYSTIMPFLQPKISIWQYGFMPNSSCLIIIL